MLINQASIWIHRPSVRRAGTKSNTNTPEATSDIGTCLSAAACEEEVKDNQHNRNHFYSTVALSLKWNLFNIQLNWALRILCDISILVAVTKGAQLLTVWPF